MSAEIDLVALTLLPVGRWRAVAELLQAGWTAPAILEQQCDYWAARVASRLPCPGAPALRGRAMAALERATRQGVECVPLMDPRYPSGLRSISDPPPILWVRGSLSVFDASSVAIVGSRSGSPYALAVAERLSADLGTRGIVVTSGLARGVDSAAHRGALSVGGHTLAVLGCGVDVVYPREHRALMTDIAATGAVVSELVPGTPPQAQFFPRRNRIISGLSKAVVVIEAGEKSGSLITARWALEQGRDVLAVPGNVLNGRNRGGHALLRDGAKIVETADDIVEELGFGSGFGRSAAASTRVAAGAVPESDAVLACLLPGEPSDVDTIAERSGLTTAGLLTRLFELELAGLVGRAAGGRFVRLDRTC
jgi:DNA processing protein